MFNIAQMAMGNPIGMMGMANNLLSPIMGNSNPFAGMYSPFLSQLQNLSPLGRMGMLGGGAYLLKENDYVRDLLSGLF